MYYDQVEKSLQAVFRETLSLSSTQRERLSRLMVALLLAGETALPRIARQLPQVTQQDSRIRWIKGLLEAPFMTQEHVYQPYIRHLLHRYQEPTLHLTLDRTDLLDHDLDLLSINLSFRKRAIPLSWQLCPTGMTSAQTQIHLLTRCQALLPTNRQFVVHGDNEFGSVAVMRWLRCQKWDFILGQSAKNYYRQSSQDRAFPLMTLPVTPTQPAYLRSIDLTKAHWFGSINLVAFYKPVYHRNRRKQDVCYYATSLPLAPTLRRVGKRRWGIECFFKDLKSAGWNLPLTQIHAQKRLPGLLLTLNLAYTWATCIGRWLCKTSQRALIDNHPTRHLSLFRIGWDWLIHAIRCQIPCPQLTTLYS